MTIRTQLGAEASQKKSAPGMKGPGRRAKQERATYGPCLPAHAVRQGERRPEVGVGGLGCSIHLYYTMTSERRSWNGKTIAQQDSSGPRSAIGAKVDRRLDWRLIVAGSPERDRRKENAAAAILCRKQNVAGRGSGKSGRGLPDPDDNTEAESIRLQRGVDELAWRPREKPRRIVVVSQVPKLILKVH